MSRYYSRNRLAQSAINKISNDRILKEINRDQWYKLIDGETLPQFKHFVQLNEDEETKKFLENCFELSENFLTQLFHSLMLSFLRIFLATTSINGLLQRGSMFVFSMQQFSTLINFESEFGGNKLNNLLDLGAGDGAVTAKMAPFFNNIYATEMSVPMQWRLKQKGYTILDVFNWDTQIIDNNIKSSSSNLLKYDAIACLNLLDRCDEPVTLLKNIKKALTPNGLLIVALVLPFKPFVEYKKDNMPTENLLDLKNKLSKKNQTCNQQAKESVLLKNSAENGPILNKVNYQINYLIEELFEPLGFEIQKFTRLPYLCEGNMEQSFYFLHDYVFVFKSID